jgi:hypothetical protein
MIQKNAAGVSPNLGNLDEPCRGFFASGKNKSGNLRRRPVTSIRLLPANTARTTPVRTSSQGSSTPPGARDLENITWKRWPKTRCRSVHTTNASPNHHRRQRMTTPGPIKLQKNLSSSTDRSLGKIRRPWVGLTRNPGRRFNPAIAPQMSYRDLLCCGR